MLACVTGGRVGAELFGACHEGQDQSDDDGDVNDAAPVIRESVPVHPVVDAAEDAEEGQEKRGDADTGADDGGLKKLLRGWVVD